MSADLFMIELLLDAEALVRFLQGRGINHRQDEDLGYGCHAWLTAAFGSLAPKPFRMLMGGKSRNAARILAYGPHGMEALRRYLTEYAEPGAHAVCSPECISAKKMPVAWEAGRTLGFEVLACPVSRREGTEKDVYLRQADRGGPEAGLQREAVYGSWLAAQMQGAADPVDVRLVGFRLIRFFRNSHGSKAARGLRPQAMLAGRLRVVESEAFARMLARGIGRHRAFGYGMLLLRPV